MSTVTPHILNTGTFVRPIRQRSCIWAHVPTAERLIGTVVGVLDGASHPYLVRFVVTTALGVEHRDARYSAAELDVLGGL